MEQHYKKWMELYQIILVTTDNPMVVEIRNVWKKEMLTYVI